MSTNAHRLLLDEVDYHFQQAIQARDRADILNATSHLERSSTSLLHLAKITRNPALKKQRIVQAERMQAMVLNPKRIDKAAEGGNSITRPKLSASNKSYQAKSKSSEPEIECNEDDVFTPASRPTSRLSDVAGLDDVKREIRLRMIDPFRHPELAQKWGLRPGGGMLLYGPPGTGKTFIARATAGELSIPFYAIKASDVMTKWVGEAEQRITALFEEARRHEKAVIFIDEIESLLPSRANNGSTVMARVVPQFLAEMDGFEKHKNSLMFIGATNEPWSLDPAVLRPGRLDVHVLVGLPDVIARFEMLKKGLSGMPLTDLDLSELADQAKGFSGADIDGYCDSVAKSGFEGQLGGERSPLLHNDLLEILKHTRPSVSKKSAMKFDKFNI